MVIIDIALFTQKAYLIEDIDYELFVTTQIPLTDDWEQAYNKVLGGFVLNTDDYGNGYFIEKPEANWIILKDYKPTGKVIEKSQDKEFIIKCMEIKKADLENEFLEAKRRWTEE